MPGTVRQEPFYIATDSDLTSAYEPWALKALKFNLKHAFLLFRSRPSSMLFNDAGFVRFRLGNDPNLAQTDVLRQSCQVTNHPRKDRAAETVMSVSKKYKSNRTFN